MSLAFKDAKLLTWQQERMYNLKRAEVYSKFKKQAKEKNIKYTETEFEHHSKLIAEQEYGDWRVNKAKSQWFGAVIASIETFIIAYHTENKANNEAIINDLSN